MIKNNKADINSEGPCLFLAGGRKRKTKVLTHKIAYLIGEKCKTMEYFSYYIYQ